MFYPRCPRTQGGQATVLRTSCVPSMLNSLMPAGAVSSRARPAAWPQWGACYLPGLACTGYFWAGWPAGLPRGGRPGRRIFPAWLGIRPASASARRSRNSIWALVLRNSSAAHRARASWTAGSSRSNTLLRSLTALPCLPSLVEGPGVDDLLGGLLAAQDHEQVGHHRGLALLIELDHVLFFQPLEGELDHADRSLDDLHPGAHHGAGLLLAQHCLGNLRGIRQPGQPRLDDRHPGRCDAVGDLCGQLAGDLLRVVAQRQHAAVLAGVGVPGCDVADRGLGLDRDELGVL